ncbi:efflux RND transporter periplasmic adaptor subunit [Dysgonomonas massiliensis]|uniref:efflux RND transporter periplasmic adaptor subunit n=1 Tax=Dysgonomonas massiliensis TaxID=2040292 RepID=UPI000C76F2D8|nr:efflux RND transporter periplasmic adaptor subunit [Dysgonomonas massiliensis]
MKLKRISIGFFALLLLVSCGNKQTQAEAAAPELKVTIASEQNIELNKVFAATIKGSDDAEIRPRIDGYIDRVYVEEGQIVRKGQPLFLINSPMAQQQLRTAEAALKSAEANVATAKLNVDRTRPLVEEGIISAVQLQTYENVYQTALAAQAQAQATLDNARSTISWTRVESPIDGVVGRINMRIGNLVNASNILTTIANTKNVYAEFSLNEKDLASWLKNLDGKTQAEKIKNIPPVTLRLKDGTEIPEKGKIETIAGVIDVTTGSVNLRAEFPNSDGLIRSGNSATVIIPEYLNNTIVIPQSITTALQDKVIVFKLVNDTARQTVIDVESTPDGKQYAVLSGLATGDKIISEGIGTIRNGMAVKEKK